MEAQTQELLRHLRAGREAVQDAAPALCLVLPEDFQYLGIGFAAVEDDGFVASFGDFQLAAESLLLGVGFAERLAIEVQSNLTHGHRLGGKEQVLEFG
jgi:hypothetical protein